jgi:hypothetical protein
VLAVLVVLGWANAGVAPNAQTSKKPLNQSRALNQHARRVVASKMTNMKGAAMNISVSLGPLAALIAGILILVAPRLLNYIVALYLIIIGLVGLLGPGAHSLHL